MKSTRSLFFSCILAFSLVHYAEALSNPNGLIARQVSTGAATSPPPTVPSSSPPLPPPPPVSSSDPQPPPTISTTPASSIEVTSQTSQVAPTTTPTSAPPVATASSTPPPLTSVPQTSSAVVTTNSAGDETTVTVLQSPSITSSAPATSSSGTKKKDSSNIGTGPIIGLSVAGGLALLGIIGFFVWKLTRKRITDFDDNEAIKWPELNAHGSGTDSHPLPVHNTGRSGFDTGSEFDLSRPPSNAAQNPNYSTSDLGSAADPYAVPPLPHLNPNQPYRDDPGVDDAGYYDPYRGPVPNTFNDPSVSPEWGPGGEAIPMTQMVGGAAAAGRRSPGPGMAYETGRASPGMGRKSPGPQVAYGEPPYEAGAGRRSPGPNAAYEGRTSPGPQVAYGGRASPGPQAAYGVGTGRTSPGPQAAYGSYR